MNWITTQCSDLYKRAGKNSRIVILGLFSLLLFLFHGCFGGGGVGDYEVTNERLENQTNGWKEFFKGETEKSKIYFYRLLSDPHPSVEAIDEAYLGLAWSYARENNHATAISFFDKLQGQSYDGNIGLAACLMKSGGTANLERAIEALESIGLSSPTSTIASEHALSYSSDSAHALLGTLYLMTGRTGQGLSQFNAIAKQEYYEPYLKDRIPLIIEMFSESTQL